MRKIVIHLNDEVLGIAIDDSASDEAIEELAEFIVALQIVIYGK